jgi:hypothetical protein
MLNLLNLDQTHLPFPQPLESLKFKRLFSLFSLFAIQRLSRTTASPR